LLSCSVRTIYRMCAEGTLVTIRLRESGGLRILTESVRALAEKEV